MAEDKTSSSQGTSRRELLRRLAIPMLLLGTGLTVAACGKKPGSLRIPPDDAGSTDRNSYPPQDDDL
jgi:hypothetical protein